MATIGVKLRVFVPKEVMNIEAVNRAIQHTMVQKTIPDLKREFGKTVSTWSDKPGFQTDQYFGQNVMWVKVYTYSTHYRLVNAGARPHEIRPRRARLLRFQSEFRPKSRPKLIRSFAGGKSGGYVSTPSVQHPGFEAREFDTTIAEEYTKTFHDDIQKAVEEGIEHA